jgi:hypothetical protein
MKTICAWCQRLMTDGPAFPVSHGMCTTCQARLEAELAAR